MRSQWFGYGRSMSFCVLWRRRSGELFGLPSKEYPIISVSSLYKSWKCKSIRVSFLKWREKSRNAYRLSFIRESRYSWKSSNQFKPKSSPKGKRSHPEVIQSCIGTLSFLASYNYSLNTSYKSLILKGWHSSGNSSINIQREIIKSIR